MVCVVKSAINNKRVMGFLWLTGTRKISFVEMVMLFINCESEKLPEMASCLFSLDASNL